MFAISFYSYELCRELDKLMNYPRWSKIPCLNSLEMVVDVNLLIVGLVVVANI